MIVRDKTIAFFASALFMVHPSLFINVQMVAQNFVFLNILFNVLSLGFFLKSFADDKFHYGFYILNFIFFLIGLLTFEISGLLFAHVFLLSFFILKKSFGQSLKLCLPYLFVTACFAFVYLQEGSGLSAGEAMEALDLSPGSLLASYFLLQHWYVGNLLLPADYIFMKNIYPVTEQISFLIGVILFYLIVLALLVSVFWRRSLKSMALFWFLLGFPFSFFGMFAHYYMGLVMEPHWLSFPSIGFFLLLALIAKDLDGLWSRKIGSLMLISLLSFFILEGQMHQRVSLKERSYAYYWEATSPNNVLALMSLAMSYLKEKEYEKAVFFAHQAKRACVYDPYRANLTVGNFYLDMRDQQSAIFYFRKAMEIDPRHPAAYLQYAVALKRLGKMEEAERYLRQGIALRGDKFKGLAPN